MTLLIIKKVAPGTVPDKMHPRGRGIKPWSFYQIAILFTTRNRVFFAKSNGEEPVCTVCGGKLKYRDRVPRIMRRLHGETSHVLIERRKCQNPACGKLHRCLPSQLTRFKHFATEVIEDTCDEVVIPEDPESPDFIESPSPRTVAGWKEWVRHNTPNINGYLRTAGYSILGFSVQFLKSGVSLLDELRKDGGGWLAAIQQIIYNSGGFLEPWYR